MHVYGRFQRLFHASIMLKYVIYICGIIGMFPYRLNDSSSSNNNNNNYSKKYRLKVDFWFSVCTLIAVTINAMTIVLAFDHNARVSYCLQTMLLIFKNGQTILLIFRRLIRTKKTTEIFEKLFKLIRTNNYRTDSNGNSICNSSGEVYIIFVRNQSIVFTTTFIQLTVIIYCHVRKLFIDKDLFQLGYVLVVCSLTWHQVALELQYEFLFAILEDNFRFLNDAIITNNDDDYDDNSNDDDDDNNNYNNDNNNERLSLYRLRRRHSFLSDTVDELHEYFSLEFLILSSSMASISFYLISDLIVKINGGRISKSGHGKINATNDIVECNKYLIPAVTIIVLHVRFWFFGTHIDRMIYQQEKTVLTVLKRNKHTWTIPDIKQLIRIGMCTMRRKINLSNWHFCSMNMEQVFSAFGALIGFSLIFAQLSHSRQWIQ